MCARLKLVLLASLLLLQTSIAARISQPAALIKQRKPERRPAIRVNTTNHSPAVYAQLYLASQLLGNFPVVQATSRSDQLNYAIPQELRDVVKSWVSAASSTLGNCGLDVFVLEAVQQLPEQNYMIVANLYNSEQVMPHFMQQLVTACALLPQGRVFVSIYESSSKPEDKTKAWLKELKTALRLIGVRSRIIYGGALSRSSKENRIEYLAKVRNAALAPLYNTAFRKQVFDPDKVIFVNDIFYCANDLLRLLLHKADLACGLDIVHNYWKGYLFYDFWVMRDVAGARAIDSHPFLRHEASAERVKKGLPLPVQCCWNGMAAFSALPFKQGIKIRSHLAGECAASECSLLCDDMHRMGYRNVMVDPSVRVAYKADDFNRMHSEPGPLMYTPYKDLAGQLSYKELISTELFKRSDMVECCDLPPDSDQIAWGKPDACRFLNVTATNYTAPYVHGLF